MLNVTREERDAYIGEHDRPVHRLAERGHCSIGCTHCTSPGSGRRTGTPKTECGLRL